ncbi:MAG: amidohydrolase [Bryobacterales bacterium]|nr:amidohydrolase [Bryobacterales bacterium]
MIVDCHTHIWRAEHWSEEMNREASIARGAPAQIHITEEEHWKAMEPATRAVVFGFRCSHLGLSVPNELVIGYVNQHPEKLIGFAAIDPYEADYLDQMRHCFETLGFRGLKLAPIYQNYHCMDPRMLPVYDYCQSRGIPVLFHQGTTFPRRAPLRYARPVDLEDIALAYPGLRMVIAHMGHPWMDETTVLIRKQPNVYADVSALYYRPWQFYNGLMIAQEYGCLHKLLLGSDYPFTTPGETVQRLRRVNEVTGNSGLPQVSLQAMEELIERDTVSLLNLS